MWVTLDFVLILAAAACFLFAGANYPSSRVNLIGVGLFCWVLTLLTP